MISAIGDAAFSETGEYREMRRHRQTFISTDTSKLFDSIYESSDTSLFRQIEDMRQICHFTKLDEVETKQTWKI